MSMKKSENFKIKFLPKTGKYAILDISSNNIVKEVKTAEDAGYFKTILEEDSKTIIEFGDHVPAFI